MLITAVLHAGLHPCARFPALSAPAALDIKERITGALTSIGGPTPVSKRGNTAHVDGYYS